MRPFSSSYLPTSALSRESLVVSWRALAWSSQSDGSAALRSSSSIVARLASTSKELLRCEHAFAHSLQTVGVVGHRREV
jgi:hypothetical protein